MIVLIPDAEAQNALHAIRAKISAKTSIRLLGKGYSVKAEANRLWLKLAWVAHGRIKQTVVRLTQSETKWTVTEVEGLHRNAAPTTPELDLKKITVLIMKIHRLVAKSC